MDDDIPLFNADDGQRSLFGNRFVNDAGCGESSGRANLLEPLGGDEETGDAGRGVASAGLPGATDTKPIIYRNSLTGEFTEVSEQDMHVEGQEGFQQRGRRLSLMVRSENGCPMDRLDSLEQDVDPSVRVPSGFEKTMLDIKGLPKALRDQLSLFDDNGNGELDLGELAHAALTIQKLRTETDAFSIDAFPKHLQKELKAFDVDEDGKFSAAEIIRACRLYHETQIQLRRLVKGLMLLAMIIAITLGINMALSFAVTILSKEVTVDKADGLMYTPNKGAIISTGSVADVIEVIADHTAFRNLTGRNTEPPGKNHLEIMPEAVALVFADMSIINTPINWMSATPFEVSFGNTDLDYTIRVEDGIPPRLQTDDPYNEALFQRMDERYKNLTAKAISEDCGLQDSDLPYHVCKSVKASTVMLLRVYIGKQFVTANYNPSETDVNLNNLSQKIEFAINLTTETSLISPERETAARSELSKKLVQQDLQLVPVEDLSEQIQKNPLANLARGNVSSWMAHFGNQLESSHLRDFCEMLEEEEYAGKCMVDCNGTSPCEYDAESMAPFQSIGFLLDMDKLDALLHDERMANSGAELNLELISKAFQVTAPSIRTVHEKYADPFQNMRHDQMKELVMSTRHGRRLLKQMRELKGAAKELHQRRRLLTDVQGMDFYNEFESENNFPDTDCYMKEMQYSGTASVSVDNEYCRPWKQEDFESVSSEDIDMDLDTDSLINKTQCIKLKAEGDDAPVCPTTYGERTRVLSKCDVKHCFESLYTGFIGEPHNEQLINITWGKNRVLKRNVTYLDEIPINELKLDGTDVHCYVVDSGINLHHAEFSLQFEKYPRRVEYDAFTGKLAQTDDHGHGTHVAGIIAGKTTGIAPGCHIHAIKVLDENKNGGSGVFGDSTFHGLTAVFQHFQDVQRNARRQGKHAKGVVNLSLAAEASTSFANAVKKLNSIGLVVVAAAGNKDQDACSFSPAAEDDAITVGATNLDDSKAVFSNWGACVQIYAPGSGIKSASRHDNSSYVYYSGTSMAAPFVSGAVALYLQAHQSINVSPAAARRFIYESALVGKVHGVDKKKEGLAEYGMTEDLWKKTERLAYRQGFKLADDEDNVNEGMDNRLLHIDGEILSDEAAEKECSAEDDKNWGPWDLFEFDCPPPGPICGTRAPMVMASRRCIATDCVCNKEYQKKLIYCDAADYQLVPDCGVPMASIESKEDIEWLQGRRLRFIPQDGSGTIYDVCESNTLWSEDHYNFGYSKSMLSKLKAGYAGQVLKSLQAPFWFKDTPTPNGTMMPFEKMTIFSSGHIKFGDWRDHSHQMIANGFTIASHKAKGLGISGLFTGLDFSNCKFSTCGDLRVHLGRTVEDDMPVAVIEYDGVPSKHAPVDDPEFRSSFKIILYLGDGKHKGVFELVYDKISMISQNGAVYGISLGQDMLNAPISPMRAVKCFST